MPYPGPHTFPGPLTFPGTAPPPEPEPAHDHRVVTRVRPDRPPAAVRPDRATRVRSDPR